MAQESRAEAAFWRDGIPMMKRSVYRICLRLPRTTQFGSQSSSGRNRRSRGEEGAAMVEMAISIVILLTIVFGIIATCMALYTYHYISDAAREGTRFAIVRGAACVSPGYECNATKDQVQTYVQGLGFPGIDPSAMKVDTEWTAYPVGTNCTPSALCNNPGDLVTVTVHYNFPLSIPFVPSRTISMSSTSAMIISQ